MIKLIVHHEVFTYRKSSKIPRKQSWTVQFVPTFPNFSSSLFEHVSIGFPKIEDLKLYLKYFTQGANICGQNVEVEMREISND